MGSGQAPLWRGAITTACWGATEVVLGGWIARVVVGLAMLAMPSGCILSQDRPSLQRAYALRPGEGVFAYARVSPDGESLAYASEAVLPSDSTRIVQTVEVIDLRSGRVLFEEPGVDAYWSTDGLRVVFLSFLGGRDRVSVWNRSSGTITRDIVPPYLGDYFSWGVRDGRDLILTILGHYFRLEGDTAILPSNTIPSCPGIGAGDRPLLSKDGKRVTVFVRGRIVVRDLADCDNIIDTHIEGAKADFSWDGRYIAFHTVKQDGAGYDIDIVDLVDMTVRRAVSLPGSSLFPSWTRDGRLCFRYDGADYRGFMMASDVLAAPAYPLATRQAPDRGRLSWSDVFPTSPRMSSRVELVTVWSPWSPHMIQGFADLGLAQRFFSTHAWNATVATAVDPASRASDVTAFMRRLRVQLPVLPMTSEQFLRSWSANQNPTTLAFRDGVLVDRRLGAQSVDELISWVQELRMR